MNRDEIIAAAKLFNNPRPYSAYPVVIDARMAEFAIKVVADETARADKAEAKLTECRRMLIDAVNLGQSQGNEYDRFWKAMDCGTPEITVDDAIAKYRTLEAKLKELVDWVNGLRVADWGERYGRGWMFTLGTSDEDGSQIVVDNMQMKRIASAPTVYEAVMKLEGEDE